MLGIGKNEKNLSLGVRASVPAEIVKRLFFVV